MIIYTSNNDKIELLSSYVSTTLNIV